MQAPPASVGDGDGPRAALVGPPDFHDKPVSHGAHGLPALARIRGRERPPASRDPAGHGACGGGREEGRGGRDCGLRSRLRPVAAPGEWYGFMPALGTRMRCMAGVWQSVWQGVGLRGAGLRLGRAEPRGHPGVARGSRGEPAIGRSCPVGGIGRGSRRVGFHPTMSSG